MMHAEIRWPLYIGQCKSQHEATHAHSIVSVVAWSTTVVVCYIIALVSREIVTSEYRTEPETVIVLTNQQHLSKYANWDQQL